MDFYEAFCLFDICGLVVGIFWYYARQGKEEIIKIELESKTNPD